jgi:peptide/nickel transport system permease protein
MMRRAKGMLGLLAFVALAAPWCAPYSPTTTHRDFLFAPPMRPRLLDGGSLAGPFARPVKLVDRLDQRYEEDPSGRIPLPWFSSADAAPVFLLGADSFGRDVLSRLLWGARVSVGLALVSVLGAIALGTLAGAWAGYRGGWLDEALMRAVDFVTVLPVIYVVLVLRAVMPLVLAASTVFILMAVIFAIVGAPTVARSVRAIVRSEREREYVLAAHSLGAGGWRIVLRHLLPACRGYLLVQATLLLPAFILAEATLSYVGLGFPDQVATWGTMLIEAANLGSLTRFPWTLAPAAAIFVVVFVANALAQSSGAPAALPEAPTR